MTRGLAEKRVVNTRAAHQAAALDEILRTHGAVPLSYPCIEIAPVEDPAAFDAALRELADGGYHWLALTSANAVLAIAGRLDALAMRLPAERFRCAAIGPATLAIARRLLGLEAAVLPDEFVAESLGEGLPVRAGERVLLPESAIARPVLARLLTERGARVTVVPAYRTRRGRGGVDVPRLLAEQRVDALTFTSASTVTHFVERLSREGGRFEDVRDVCAACIGPVTAEAAHAAGFATPVVPSEYTMSGLADALDRYFSGKPLTQGEQP